MSKISFKPADTGTATFTIEAPATNTNRTLTLPDEAGTILNDTSTIDSNNLQSDVYKQSNILGTVSESSGVPTGAVIERGSNANGKYVRFADGTMICWHDYAYSGGGSSSGTSNGFKLSTFGESANQKATFASAFVNDEYGFSWTGNGAERLIPAALRNKTASSVEPVFTSTSTLLSVSGRIYFVATGRWY